MAIGRMSTLRVAWDNCFARKSQGGSGVYAARLLEQFAHRADLSLTVFNGWPENLQCGNFAARALRTSGNMLWMHAHLPAVLWKRGFDVLHAPAFIAPVASPCPVVITVHDVTYLLYPEHFSGWWATYVKSVMPTAAKSAAAIICGSEHSKRDIVKAYGLSGEKVRVVPYGVDHDRFRPGATLDSDWARALGIREGYLLHVGVFSRRKNIPCLLRAIAQLRAKGNGRDVQLVLAGSEAPGVTGAAEIHQTIQELHLADSIVLAGHVPDQHIPGLYAQAKALVMPSLYEGFGFPVLESMAAGTPVVASNTSSLPEVAGDAAILVSPTDEHALVEAMEDVIHNPGTVAELKARGLARAKQFNWQRTAAETLEVYRTVVR
jgi:glycosyltransferase involved in cell wall biosynthesis